MGNIVSQFHVHIIARFSNDKAWPEPVWGKFPPKKYTSSEIKVILINLGQESFKIEKGLRIAQMVVCPIVQAQLKEVDDLSETERGKGGFGSTGTK